MRSATTAYLRTRTLTLVTPEAIREQAKRILAKRLVEQERRKTTDIVDYAHENYYVVDEDGEAQPIALAPFQQGVLRCVMQRNDKGRLRYSTALISTIKKTGKTTMSGVVARFVAEVKTRMGEVYCIGNDFDQARDRAFKSVSESIRLTPGATQRAGDWILPGRWIVQKTMVSCLSSGSTIKPIAVDSRGEAGGNPDLTVWTELWGFEYKEAIDFWNELTPVPTKRDSMRLVETYAGYDGESHLLRGLFDTAQAGHQLTNHEFALIACANDETQYEQFLSAFEETAGDPAAPVPIWANDNAGLLMYYDEDEPLGQARRMPWQRGEEGDTYYREQEAMLKPPAYARVHRNKWVGGEGEFVPMQWWDALTCKVVQDYHGEPDTLPLFTPGKTPVILGVDAATTSDCFGVVAVTRHPNDPTMVAVRAVRRWEPPPGGRIDYSEPEAFIRMACATYNVQQIAYDPYQLEEMMQRLRRESVAWCEEFNQGTDRLIADSALYDLINNKRIYHDGNEVLREHVANANVKLQKDEDSKMRIVKRAANRKIDLVVALSMAAHRCLYLNL